MRGGELKSFGWQQVQNVGGHGKSSGSIGRRNACMKKEGTNHVIGSANDALDLPF